MPVVATHPSPDELSAYGLGQLPPDEAAVIESHISECLPCCEIVAGTSSEDTFMGLLKEARQLPEVDPGTGSQTTSLSTSDVPAPLASHPRYEIVQLIGKGGMGDVYKARHRMMERTVALKIINRDLVRKPEAVDRFHREVKTAAQLAHPNIVTAHDAEQAGDVHYLVMECVDGVDLADIVKERGALPISEACDYVRQAAIGLQYAHEQGMVHRDIKPHNLMVTANGTVKILDFGLASLAPEEALPDSDTVEVRNGLTAAGSIMGTPDFISPEQADDATQADIRSDLYSLGTTLYFLLSGRPPFADGSVMHKLKSHAQVEPEQLASLRDGVPDELMGVVSRMMAKDPDDRFQTSTEAAAALEPFCRTSQAVPEPSSRPQTQRRPQRNPILAMTTLATVVFAAISAFVVYYIVTDKGIVGVEADESFEVTIDGQVVTAKEGNNQPIEVQPGEHKLVVTQDGKELITDQFEILHNGKIAFKVELIEGKVVVSKDGDEYRSTRLPDTRPENPETKAAATNEPAVANKPANELSPHQSPRGVEREGGKSAALVKVMSAPDKKKRSGPPTGSRYVATSDDGKYLIASYFVGWARTWNVRTGEPTSPIIDIGSSCYRVGFIPRSSIAWTQDSGGSLRLLNAETGELIRNDDGPSRGETAGLPPAFTPDGKIMVSPNRYHKLEFWDLKKNELIKLHNRHISWVACSSDGKFGFTYGRDKKGGRLDVWDPRTGETIGGPFRESSTRGGAWDLFGAVRRDPIYLEKTQQLLTFEKGEDDRTELVVRSASPAEWPVVRRVRLPFQVEYVYWLNENHLLVDGSVGTKKKKRSRSLYKVPVDARDASQVKVVSPKKYDPYHFVLDPAGGRWLNLRKDSLTCWKLGEETPIWTQKFPSMDSRQRGVVSDDGWVLVHDAVGAAFVFDLNDGTELWRTFGIHWAQVQGSTLLVGDSDGAEVWRSPKDQLADNAVPRAAPVREPQQTLTLPANGEVMAVSHDGQKLVAQTQETSGKIGKWDLASGELDFVFRGSHKQGVDVVAISPSGQFVATGSTDRTVILWNAETGDEIATLTVDEKWKYVTDGLKYVTFSPSGKYLLASSGINVTKGHIWDGRTGKPVSVLDGHTDVITQARFSQDEKQVLTGSQDKTARLWDIATGKVIHTFQHESMIQTAEFSPDGKTILTAPSGRLSQYQVIGSARTGRIYATDLPKEHFVRLWDAQTGKQRWQIRHPSGALASFAADPKQIVTACRNRITWWDAESGAEQSNIECPGIATSSGRLRQRTQITPDGKNLIAMDIGETASVWSLERRAKVCEFPTGTKRSPLISHDRRTVYSMTSRGTFRAWTIQDESPADPVARVGAAEDADAPAIVEKIRTLPLHAKSTAAVSFSGNGLLATTSMDRTVKLWNVKKRQLAATLDGFPESAEGTWDRDVVFSPDGSLLAIATTGEAIQVYQTETKQQLWRSDTGARSLAFAPNGKTLISADWEDADIKVWDAHSGDLLKTLQGTSATLKPDSWCQGTVAYAPDGKTFATAVGGADRSVRFPTRLTIWDAESLTPRTQFDAQKYRVHAMAYSPDGKTLAIGGVRGTLRLVSLPGPTDRDAAAKVVATFERIHPGTIMGIAWSPDGKLLASCSREYGKERGRIVVWRTADTTVPAFVWDGPGVPSIQFSRDGKNMASSGEDGAVTLWQINPVIAPPIPEKNQRDPSMPVAVHGDARFRYGSWVTSLCFSPDGKLLASSGGNWGTALWDAESGELVRHFPAHEDAEQYSEVAFSPDGKLLVVAADDLSVWEVASRELLYQINDAGQEVRRVGVRNDRVVRFTRDGRHFLAVGIDAVLFIETSSGQIVSEIPIGEDSYINGIALSPDGSRVIISTTSYPETGRYEYAVNTWDLKSGTEILPPPRHGHIDETLSSIQFTPDGQSVAIADRRRFQLLDPQTLKLQREFQIPTGLVRSYEYTPDGKLLAVETEDASSYFILLIDPADGRLVRQLRVGSKHGRGVVLAVSPDRQTIASAFRNDLPDVTLWDMATGEERFPHKEGGATTALRMVALGDGQTLVTQDENGRVFRRDLKTGRVTRDPEWTIPDSFESMGMSPGATDLRGSDLRRMVKDPQLKDSDFVADYSEHRRRLWNARISADGNRVAVLYRETVINVYDRHSGKRLRHFGDYQDPVRVMGRTSDLDLSADGSRVVGYYSDIRQAWNVETGEKLTPPSDWGHYHLAPDGTLVIVSKQTARLWNVDEGKYTGTLSDQPNWIGEVAFSPDGKLMATGRRWGTNDIAIWDLATRKLIRVLRGTRGEVSALCFSPDGRKLYASDASTRTLVWELPEN